jgi:di/tricarboxylate transporter
MDLAPQAIMSMAITLGALLVYTRSSIRLEHSSLAILFVLVVAFEIVPYRGLPAVDESVREAAREVSPNVTPEVAPDSTRPDVPAPEADSAEEPSAPDRPPVVLRGSDFLLGFGNEALITICLLLILAKGVETSGALRPVGRLLARMWSFDYRIASLVTLVLAAFLSAFVNNTPIVVMMLPLLVGMAVQIGVTPSRMLMPLGFATILGGMCTTIGTSTNLLVASVSRELGGPEFAIFDFVLPASLAAAVGIVYLWAVAPRLIPERAPPLVDSEPRQFHAVLRVQAGSSAVGQTVADAAGELENRIRVERVQRAPWRAAPVDSSTPLRAGDLLHIVGSPEALKTLQGAFAAVFENPDPLSTPDQRLVEVVVTQTSPLYGKRLSELGAVTDGLLWPVGLRKPMGHVRGPLREAVDPVLNTGDLLLMQGHRQDIGTLKERMELLILDGDVHVARTAKAPLAVALLLTVVLAAALGVVSIMVSALIGVGLMLLGRALSWDEAWRAIDTRLALVIVTSLALGTSLSATGATEFLARGFVAAVEDLPPAAIVSGLLLATALLTEVVTNNAVAVVATPIALGIANQLGQPPTPFVLAVLFGANMSYLTPIGYQTNLLVLSAGGYRFSDFARAGLPLQLLMWLVLSAALPVLYL